MDINKAERLGVLGQTDLEINVKSGQIEAMLIPTLKWFGMKKHGSDIRVEWEQIKKIGQDMIIIDMQNELESE